MKNILIIIFIISMNVTAFAQTEAEGIEISAKIKIETKYESGYYKVNKIHTANNYYLVFVTKDNERYTIFSNKEHLQVNGKKIEKDSTYYFEIITNLLTSNGKPITEMPNYSIRHLGFTFAELGTLCTARNLFGLVVIKNYSEPDKK
ncbi:MAG: hypothetical protein LBT56_06585 [Prevotellaceae bacterium]|nr:hypothetical protein [Prevotellaceae bacterium]